MTRYFTLEYWMDDGWFVGRLKEIPNGLSQGETLDELQENILDAYKMVMEDSSPPMKNLQTLEMTIDVY